MRATTFLPQERCRSVAAAFMGQPDHYATLGLERDCTAADIRAAYRYLARQHHPDLHGGSAEAVERTQALNAAHGVLGDPERREAYDGELRKGEAVVPGVGGRRDKDVAQDVMLRLEDFIRGVALEITVRDPGSGMGLERLGLSVPAGTVPGTRMRVARAGLMRGGQVTVRLKPAPDSRFKVRGSDLRCDLRIGLARATRGGEERVRGVDGGLVTVRIPARVARGTVLRVAGEGLPKKGLGRGDLLVRIVYRPEVKVMRGGR